MGENLKNLSKKWMLIVNKLTHIKVANSSSRSMLAFIIGSCVVFVICSLISDNLLKLNAFLAFADISLLLISIFFINDNLEESIIDGIRKIPINELSEVFVKFLIDNEVAGVEGRCYLKMALDAHSETVNSRKNCGERVIGYLMPILTGIFGVLVTASNTEDVLVGKLMLYFLLTVCCVVLFFAFSQIYQILIAVFDAKYIYLHKTIVYLENVTGEDSRGSKSENEGLSRLI